MSLDAVDDVTDAIATTRGLLTPLDARTWAKLAIITFFIGGGMSLPTAQFGDSGTTSDAPIGEAPDVLPDDLIPLLVVLGIIAVLLAVAFMAIGAIMEFVFIESLRREEVQIRTYFGERWGQGLRLLVFRVAIALPVFALVAGWLWITFAPMLLETGGPQISIGLFLLGLPVLFLVFLVYALVSSFTTAFVVPIMIVKECGVLAGWGRLWGTITSDWKEYLVYTLLAFILSIALGFLASIVVGLVAILLLIPIGGLALVTYLTLSFASTAGVAILIVLGLLFVLLLIVSWAIVQVPVVTYMRYYALLVLGDVAGELDPIPDQRAAVRDEGAPTE